MSDDNDGRVMRDYYEVLGVEPDVAIDQLRRAYKMAALRCHPDRNHGREEAAANEFKEVQQAYGVLSDENERAWYDAHKEAILRGDPDGNSRPDELNLYEYFSPSCYKGFGDDKKGFFGVFATVFSTIVEEEKKDMQMNGVKSKGNFNPPPFGDSTSDFHSVVGPFYQYWSCFSTRKTFAWKDEYKPHEMPDRRNRRAAEQHNQKERNKAKKEYTALVVELVANVRRRDPRVSREEERIAELEALKEEERLKKSAEAMKRRREADRKLMEEVAAEEARQAQEEADRIAALGGDDYFNGIDEQYEKYRQEEEKRKAEEMAEEEALKAEEHVCEACGGATFKGAASWQAHQNSKKHRANLKTFKKSKKSKPEDQSTASPTTTTASAGSPIESSSPKPEPPTAESATSNTKLPSSKKTKKQKQMEARAHMQKGARGQLAPLESSSSDDDDSSSDDDAPAPAAASAFSMLGKKKRR